MKYPAIGCLFYNKKKIYKNLDDLCHFDILILEFYNF